MGHERVGVLPRTARWRAVVHQMAGADAGIGTAASLANATLANVRRQFMQLADEDGLQAAFRFLIALPRSTRTNNPRSRMTWYGRCFSVQEISQIRSSPF